MTYARKALVSLEDTPYYHVVARCVRRAWLWGVDEYAGKDYSHRKQWVLDRLSELGHVFAIDLCAFAILSNHYHLVVHLDRDRALDWSDEEVIERWNTLFAIPSLVESFRKNSLTSEVERDMARSMIAKWRSRLYDLGWYMRCLNEHLARLANAEDDCTGRFWEGRYRSQALLDEAGILTAMAYVDLNPIRAGIAATPETSEYTSIHDRIRRLSARATSQASDSPSRQAPPLHRFQDPIPTDPPVIRRAILASTIPFTLTDYLALVDWTGRAIRPDNRGCIDQALPPILYRLNIDTEAWKAMMQPKGNVFGRALGQLDHMRLHAHTLGQRWIRGLHQSERLFGAR